MKGKDMRTIIIAIACVVLGFGAAYLIQPVWTTGEAAVTMSDGQQYTCGMHPEIISDKPGICPICNMKLTPKRDVGAGEGTVRIDPATKQNMGLVTAIATYQDLTRTVHTFGAVTVPEPNVHRVTLKVDGWVERLFVAEEGEQVFEGQPLLEIYSPDLITAQKELMVALKPGSNGTMARLAESARSRLRNWDISDDQLDRLVESGEVTRTLIVRAPADGHVRAKNVTEGDRVSARSTLYEIVDLSNVWIEAQVYEPDLSYLKLHQTARVSIPSLPGRSFEGRVTYISPILDSQGQTEIRLILDNPDYLLKPEMYAEVTIESVLDGQRLAIPRSAVINSGTRQLVFVADDKEAYEPRVVVTGAVVEDEMIEVVDGLAPGAAVVTSGQFLLDSETRLSEATRASGGHMHDNSKKVELEDHSDHGEDKMNVEDPYNIHTCPMPSHFHVLNYGPGECPECGMDLVPVTETDNAPIYVCPMPECKVATKEPGVCPVCNMHLKEYQPEVSRD
ncbi:MAG: efflux RND transporter periplasmic adaptor subunit [Candidatus Zixiibacteriota bacterium]|nr:MAG: efflux RND transporter periplasmic adaptor subunit [candidate division Zixibacteria bacterium]